MGRGGGRRQGRRKKEEESKERRSMGIRVGGGKGKGVRRKKIGGGKYNNYRVHDGREEK